VASDSADRPPPPRVSLTPRAGFYALPSEGVRERERVHRARREHVEIKLFLESVLTSHDAFVVFSPRREHISTNKMRFKE
jgi:hypothetical protein